MEEKKVDTEELKNEATNTVNQVKDTIKKVDIKKDSIETKGFVMEMFKNPLGKIKEIVTKDDTKYFTYAMIILAIWIIAVAIEKSFSLNYIFGFGTHLFSIMKAIVTPIIAILTMSIILFVFNKKNQKSLTTIITVVAAANIPVVIAAVVNLLTIIGPKISIITAPFTSLCQVISIILMYFTAKSVLDVEKNSDFIKKFVLIQAIYYGIYIILSLLGIYI